MKAATGAVHTHTCVPCSACLLRGLRLRRSAVAPQATGWLLAPGSTRSLRPAARAAWVRSARARCVSCGCTPRAVGTSGASANAKTATMRATTAAVHTRACVPCSACLSRCPRQRRSAAAGLITPLPAHLPPETPAADQPVCTLLGLSVSLPATTAFGSGWSLRHCLPTCHQRRQQLFNRGGGCMRESSHRGQDRYQSEHSSICVSPGQQR